MSVKSGEAVKMIYVSGLPGTTTVRVIRIKICSHCRYVVQETGLCDDACDYDGQQRTPKDFFWAVYQRTDRFLRDEVPEVSNAD